VALTCVLLGVLLCFNSRADSGVPLSLQVLLLSHLGSYDRNFKTRAGPVANVLVLSHAGNSDSAFEQAGLVKALTGLREIGGVPIRVDQAELSDIDALVRRCRTDRISVLYLTVGLEDELKRLAPALAGKSVMTVGTTGRHAENGAVVGFALEQARPKLVINLPRAKAQSVDFRAEMLRLARLVGGG
jgi:hypothetical protein